MDTTSGNEVQTIGSRLFLELSSMKFLITLNISKNFITQIDKDTFGGTVNLRILSLAHNLVSSIPNGTFIHLSRLQYLDLSANPLTFVEPGAFLNLISLNYLNVQDTELRVTTEDTFSPLVALSIFHSDKYLYCCLTNGLESITECLPEADQFSSCADLMRNSMLRVFMWILGISALLGNAFVFFERVRPIIGQSNLTKIARIQNFMVGNLAVADGIMGLYMVIIASADEFYRDRYAYYADEWQKSLVCKIAGILSILSSEASVFFMMAISVDRFIGVVFPFSRFRFNLKSVNYIAAVIWITAFVISVVPLMITGVQNSFYGRSSVCLALPLTSSRHPGWEYSVAIFLGVNFVAFILILLSYTFIFATMKLVTTQAGIDSKNRRSQEYQLAIRMSLLVFSDMFCWMPIIILGFISLTGSAEVPPTSYAWIAVFVLPLNSSLNPYLYTIFTQQSAAKKRGKSLFSKSAVSTDVNDASTKGDKGSANDDLKDDMFSLVQDLLNHNIMIFYPNCATIDGFKKLADIRSQLILVDLVSIEKDLEKALTFLSRHKLVYSGGITEDRIVVKSGSKGSQGYLVLLDLHTSSNYDDSNYASKVEDLQTLLGTAEKPPAIDESEI
ncbi:relaxin receptor 2-like [Amphiura filiformis]|uniref:relaxin receptor 2-like n=1 Tax=Amphiura filiformis TaxID=82378 RepID=UPI003B21B113